MDIKKLIRQTIKEMIEDGDIQIEVTNENSSYNKRLVTTVYYYDESSMDSREIIQETRISIN